jgi:putative transposase
VKSLSGLLNQQSRVVNFVWNYCNDIQKHALKWNKPWATGFDLNVLTTASGKELGLHSGTANAVCEQYAKSRSQRRRPYLRYRGNKSLAWVPLKGRNLRREAEGFRFAGHTLRVFCSRPLPEGKIKDGTNFSCGRRGLSTGEKIEKPRRYRNLEYRLGQAQRAHKKRLTAGIHSRITSSRRDFLHKVSHRIVREFDYIAVGNVTAAGLARTKMAKSALDASWSTFRAMLAYKAVKHGARYEEVDERFSSQVCSSCGSLPASRPNGTADLGIRHWVCSDCGCIHDRDVNSALNVLARSGHRTPVGGITGLRAA